MVAEYFQYEVEGEIGILTLNRPKVVNAVNSRMLEELTNSGRRGRKTRTSGSSSCEGQAKRASAPESTRRRPHRGLETFPRIRRFRSTHTTFRNGGPLSSV